MAARTVIVLQHQWYLDNQLKTHFIYSSLLMKYAQMAATFDHLQKWKRVQFDPQKTSF